MPVQKQKKILLAEDDAMTRLMMKGVFEALGYDYDIAQDGAQCQELLAQSPSDYGVVLMDIHMPNVSGVEAAKGIRSGDTDPPKNIPIIAVTADDNFHDVEAIGKLGITNFLRKPILASEVNVVVDQYCTPN